MVEDRALPLIVDVVCVLHWDGVHFWAWMNCIEKHTRHKWWLWNEYFIVDNYYFEDKSDYYYH